MLGTSWVHPQGDSCIRSTVCLYAHTDACKTNRTAHTTVSLRMNQPGLKHVGKSVPLNAWSGPESSRKLRFPDHVTMAQDGGNFVSLTHRPSERPGNTPGTHFC